MRDAGIEAADGLRLRPATDADLAACEAVWRDGLNDYLRRLNQLEVPADNPGLRRLHAHTLATDPDRFWVATREHRGTGPGDEAVVGFGSAVRRGTVGFLSMLFVAPGEQARGVGRQLLRAVLPDGATPILATATDTAQPISNALYARFGIVPRMPLFNVVGRPRAGWTPPSLPDGVAATALTPEHAAAVDELDVEVLGFAHPEDHAFVRAERLDGFAYVRNGRLVGYGYTSAVGRIGPLAVRDAGLMAPALGHLLTAVEPRGASAVWIPGDATDAMALVLEAGLRFEEFPLLIGWSRPFADFERYLPMSPGLL
ncbi:MAG TPA: GNAT family N-acetyltransferase [Candidatus Limnocylindrales bacterium]|nr:GNAT family N-acetyltransferase [Candidatus Limnocylindrales bacterium]